MPAYCRRPRSTATPRPAFQLAPQRRLCIDGALALYLRPCRAAASSASLPAVLCADGSQPATAPPQRPGQQSSVPAVPLPAAPPRLCLSPGAPPQLCLSPGDPPRRPGQQQTSSGGEKYCGLASNLAHLGRICKLAAVACDLSQHLFIYVPISLAAILDCCSDRRKSFGPCAPIAYATSVSPPNEAVAWPGTQVFGAG